MKSRFYANLASEMFLTTILLFTIFMLAAEKSKVTFMVGIGIVVNEPHVLNICRPHLVLACLSLSQNSPVFSILVVV